MRLFGREIKVGLPSILKWSGGSVVSPTNGGWWNLILESYAGAWAQSIVIDSPKNLLSNSGIYSCVTLIAEDIAKNRIKLMQFDDDGFTDEVMAGSAWSKVLRRPNRYQNRIQFISQWIMSKLIHGNAYILKERDARGIVRALYPLDATRVTVLVAPDGSVWYQLGRDDLSSVTDQTTFPASEIIHDRMTCLFHPLVGVSPIYAAGWAATVGNKITSNSAQFFANMSRPSGLLTAPAKISDEVAGRLKTAWQENYGGTNVGKVAVLGDGLTYEPMSVPAEQAQLVEQLKWTIEDIARCFHCPIFKVGGPAPSGATTETLNQIYYSDCLQSLIEAFELCLDEGIELPSYLGVELDLMNLIRMDFGAMNTVAAESVKGGVRAPDEARAMLNLRPVPGGKYPYLQQQNFSLEALAKRDATDDPFSKGAAPPPAGGAPALPAPKPDDGDDRDDGDGAAEAAKRMADIFIKGLSEHATTD